MIRLGFTLVLNQDITSSASRTFGYIFLIPRDAVISPITLSCIYNPLSVFGLPPLYSPSISVLRKLVLGQVSFLSQVIYISFGLWYSIKPRRLLRKRCIQRGFIPSSFTVLFPDAVAAQNARWSKLFPSTIIFIYCLFLLIQHKLFLYFYLFR